VRTKQVSPGELLDEAIAPSSATTPAHAVVLPMYDEGRRLIAAGLPDGPLRGVPSSSRTVGPYAGFPLRGASRLYENLVPERHAELTRRYLAAGVAVFGKTNSSEWGILPTVESRLYGPCHNPWRLGTTSGGSSGGAAAAVAARLVPVAHGGDAGGSIRIRPRAAGSSGSSRRAGATPSAPTRASAPTGLAPSTCAASACATARAFLDATAGPRASRPTGPAKEGP